jgi:essential nuclear protein 1
MGKDVPLRKSNRHAPLHVQMKDRSGPGPKIARIKRNKINREKAEKVEHSWICIHSESNVLPKEFLDPSLSKKILNLAREQQDEIEREELGDAEYVISFNFADIHLLHLRQEPSFPVEDSPVQFVESEDEEEKRDEEDDEFFYEDAEFVSFMLLKRPFTY